MRGVFCGSLVFLLSALVGCGPKPEAAAVPFHLSAGDSKVLALELAEDAEAVLALFGQVEGADWKAPGAESVALRVRVDKRVVRHVVWATGARPLEHRVDLGPLSAGPHEVELVWDERSRAAAARLDVDAISLTPHPDPALARFSPVLLARDDVGWNDLPALFFAVRLKNSVRYEVIFTNEDGGSGTDARVLIAESGRLTDIEWMTEAYFDAGGAVARTEYQSLWHSRLVFNGPREGDKPILRIATSNNLFTDDGGPGSYRFAPSVTLLEPGGPPEHQMDANPWLYTLSHDEVEREGRLDPTCRDPGKVWAADCYFYVTVNLSAEHSMHQRELWGIEAQVGDAWIRSEGVLGKRGRLDRQGEVRVAVPVGKGAAVSAVRAYAVGDGQGFGLQMSNARGWRFAGGQMQPVFARPEASGRLSPDHLAVWLWP